MNHKFALEHVGINCANPEEAAELAQLLSTLFNLNPRHGNKSEFGGDYFECMKTPFLGTNGHIAIATNSLKRAKWHLEMRGFAFDEDSLVVKNGKEIAIYLKDEFAGFAIHLVQK